MLRSAPVCAVTARLLVSPAPAPAQGGRAHAELRPRVVGASRATEADDGGGGEKTTTAGGEKVRPRDGLWARMRWNVRWVGLV